MRENEQAITRFPKCAFVYPHSCGRKNLKQNRRLVAASLTGISPRPMLMGAPHDALRASNAGVSLKVPVVVANRVPLCFWIALVSLPPMREIMAGAAPMAHTGTNVPVCSIPCRNRSPFQCATSAPDQPASAIKPLMADAHSRRENRGGDAERKHTAAAKQGEAF